MLAFVVSCQGASASTSRFPPDTVEQTRILADAAVYAANHEQALPNFICTQTTQRFVDFTGKRGFRPIDLIVESLTYFDHHENYKVVTVNGEPATVSHADLGGAVSTGEFGSLLRDIFAMESGTLFTWENYFTLRGRVVHVFSYRVQADKSTFHLRVPLAKLDLVTGYHGLIFIDDQQHFVQRIAQHADAIPSDYPVQDLSMVLDYGFTRIGDHEYLLPLEFELRLRDGRSLIRNDVNYEDYQKFVADADIRFEQPSAPNKPTRN